METENISVVPKNFKNKDPRTLPFLYPKSINIVAYAKSVQAFSFYQTLEVAEDLAKRQGYILLPWSCIHWERAKRFGEERKVKVGRNTFFMMRIDELTKGEKKKLLDYIKSINEEGEK